MKLVLVLVLVASPVLFGQTLIQQGEQLLKSARYTEAVLVLQQAVAATPNDPASHYTLATAYLVQWIPGATAPEQHQLAAAADRELQAVLKLDSRHTRALSTLASLSYQRAQPLPPGEEKTHRLDEANSWYDQLTRTDSTNKEAWYSLGVIAWTKTYPAMLQARQVAGMQPADPGPIRDLTARLDFRIHSSQTVEDGIHHLELALALDPKYDDAMAYLNLLYRLRADMQDDEDAYRRETKAADTWVQRALETKKEKAAQYAGASGTAVARAPAAVFVVGAQRSGNAGSIPGGVISGIISDAPPPPPPPPPHGPASANPPTLIRVGGNVMAAKLLRSPALLYPPLAQQARLQGSVRLDVLIGRDGMMQGMKVISGHPLLTQAALDAVKQYQYQPTLLNGQPVEVSTTVDVRFTLEP